MPNIPDATVAQALADANAAMASLQAAITAMSGTSGTRWSRSAINATFSNNDLTVAATGPSLVPATVFAAPSNKYGEVSINAAGNAGYLGIGIISIAQVLTNPPTSLAAVPAGAWGLRSDGYTFHNGQSSLLGLSFTGGDIMGVLLTDTGELHISKNGAFLASPVFTGIPLTDQYTIAAVFFGANGSPVVTGQFASTTYPLPPGASLYA